MQWARIYGSSLICIFATGCHVLAPAAIGGGATWLSLLETAEKDADLAITLSEETGCLIKAARQQHGDKVSALANELCAALLLERAGAVM